jgi:hypothetical protein
MRNWNIEPYMHKYAHDLALLHDVYDDGYGLMLIPRLPVKVPVPVKQPLNSNPIQDENSVTFKTRYLRRLLHPDVFEPLRDDDGLLPSAAKFDSAIYWHPAKAPRLVYSEHMCKIAGKRRREHYFLPFVAFTVSADLFSTQRVNPSIEDVNLFFEGMVAGVNELGMLPPPPMGFLRATYQRYFGTPVDVGDRVVGNTSGQQVEGNDVEGVVKDISENIVEIEDPLTGLCHACSSERVSRVFSIGDTVKVTHASSPCYLNEGWVVGSGEDKVTIIERENLQEVVSYSFLKLPTILI